MPIHSYPVLVIRRRRTARGASSARSSSARILIRGNDTDRAGSPISGRQRHDDIFGIRAGDGGIRIRRRAVDTALVVAVGGVDVVNDDFEAATAVRRCGGDEGEEGEDGDGEERFELHF